MIHIDISREKATVDHADVTYPYPKLLVQTSTDGAGWKTQYVFYADTSSASAGEERVRKQQENRAVDAARIFAVACEYATGERPRMTMFGHGI